MTDIPCKVDDCLNEAAKDGYCWGHYQRRRRGRTVDAPLKEFARTPFEAVERAALGLADVDTSDDRAYERAKKRLLKASLRYMQSLPSYRALLLWVAELERFRREAVIRLRRRAPLPSTHDVKWAGRDVRQALHALR